MARSRKTEFKPGNHAAKGKRGPRKGEGGRPTDATVLFIADKLQHAQCTVGKKRGTQTMSGREAFVVQLTAGMCKVNAKGEPTADALRFLTLYAKYAFVEQQPPAPSSTPGGTIMGKTQDNEKDDLRPMADAAIDALLKEAGSRLAGVEPVGHPDDGVAPQ